MKTLRLFSTWLVLAALCSAQPTPVSGGGDSLPSQSGNSGKFLKTDGTTAAWDTPAGAGDVVGPASATDGVPALFDTTTGKLLKNSTPTGTGNPVLATSPTLVTPALGTPSALVLTNATNLPTAGLVDAAVSLAKMANLAQDQFIGRTTASTGVPETATITASARTVLDDTSVSAMVDTLGGASATGSGGIVRATSPTLVTPALGTPSALVLTNATALPAAQVVAGALASGMTATTQTAADNSTKLGTTAYTDTAITNSLTATATLTNKRLTSRVTTITSNATPTINTDNCDAVTITALAADITSVSTNLTGTPANFDMLIIRIKDDGTARAITWGTSFEACGAALPTTTVLGKRLYALFIWDSVTSKWGCVSTAQES